MIKKPRFIQNLQRHKTKDWPNIPGRTNHIKAGILVPLFKDDEWRCILTVRDGKLRQHAGEICFPGGKPDPQDNSLAETALREAKEEIGLQHCQIQGRLSSIPLFTSDYRLIPFVGVTQQQKFIINPAEVQCILTIPILQVLQNKRIDGIPFDIDGMTHLSPVFDAADLKQGHLTKTSLFGGTAHVFYELLQIAAKSFDVQMPPMKATQRKFPFPM